MPNENGKLTKVNYWKLLIPFAVGMGIWFFPFRPEGISVEAWQMFAIFIGTIIGCIIQVMPIGAVSLVGLTVLLLTEVADIGTALSGFNSTTVWLVVMAFFLSRGFIKTGLGNRIAYIFVRMFGKRTLGLAYALIGTDLIIAPTTPSSTARAGGIMYPIARSLAETFDSRPEDGTQNKIGSYLIFSTFHGNIITSTMFLTAVASNPLAQEMAASAGVEISWFGYLLAALVPGVISLIAIPYLIYKINPPEIKETPDAPKWAEGQLEKMGPMASAEKWMLVVFAGALILWVTSQLTGLSATVTAFLAVALLLIVGVLNWDDIKKETGAWDTFIWFSVLVMMATQLNELGFIPWLSQVIAGSVAGFPWPVIMVILFLAYHYLHYLFASSTAHVSAIYPAFLGVAVAAGVPPTLAAVLLIFASGTMVSTTHYANGPAPVLFGSGYLSQNEWWKYNAILAIPYFVIWLGIGWAWLYIIGMV